MVVTNDNKGEGETMPMPMLQVQDQEEHLLKQTQNRFVLYPIQDAEVRIMKSNTQWWIW